MSKPFNDKKIENGSVSRRQVLYGPYDLLIRNSVQGIFSTRSNLDNPIIQVCGKLVFMVLTKMVNRRIYHYFSQPTFEGTYHIRICRFISVYLFEYLQKAIIQDLNSIVLVIRIPVAYSHSIAVERGIYLFLTLPAV